MPTYSHTKMLFIFWQAWRTIYSSGLTTRHKHKRVNNKLLLAIHSSGLTCLFLWTSWKKKQQYPVDVCSKFRLQTTFGCATKFLAAGQLGLICAPLYENQAQVFWFWDYQISESKFDFKVHYDFHLWHGHSQYKYNINIILIIYKIIKVVFSQHALHVMLEDFQ